MAGFALTGVDPNDPTPGTVREIRFAQGASTSGGSSRDVVLIGQKTSAGSETVDVLGAAIADEEDCIARTGTGSELHLMYRAYTDVDPNATLFFIAPTAAGTAAQAVFTFTNAATASGTFKISLLGETVEASVANGDTAITIAAAVRDKINAQAHWPLTAAVGGLGNEHVVTATLRWTGGRGDHYATRMRVTASGSFGTTVSKAPVGSGGAVDDVTAALAQLEAADIYYHVPAQTASAAVTSTDGGVGEYAAFAASQHAPSVGKDLEVVVGLVGTVAQAEAVAESANSALVKFALAQTNDWSPAMIAAHHCAAIRSKQIAFPSANMTDYGKGSGEIYRIPDPFNKGDRLTATEIRTCLNSGVTPVGFTSRGQAFIVRDITSRSLNGAVNDYRVREGHIPSAMHDFWQSVFAAYFAQKQEIVAGDVQPGKRPQANTTTPLDVKTMVKTVIDQKVDDPRGPILDPDQREAMKASVEVVQLNDGFSVRCKPVASRHNNKGQFLIEEGGAAY